MTLIHQPFEQLSVKTLYDIMNIRLTVFVEEQRIMYVDTDYKDHHAEHWMIYDDDKLVNYARVFKPGTIYENYYSIGRVATHKHARHKGYATTLLKAIQKHYHASIKISAQFYLKDYYQSLGFNPASEPYIEEGIKHISMIYKPEE
ncbi:MAG: GNAT family N-acetyltransferase [Acholeplasmataceae bacterium]